ncbi:MAG: DNA-binding protein [Pseudomonadota bacterium]
MQADAQCTALMRENRTVIDTNEAAFHLGRKPQTLRKWACNEDGPLRPIRIHGRLAWPVADIKRLLDGGANA